MYGRLLTLVLAVSVGLLVKQNPLLFGGRTSSNSNKHSYAILTSHPALDAHLEAFRSDLGDDYDKYRNHCLRVLNFAKYHLGADASESDLDLIGIGLAYHDIALWSDNKLNYLKPSADQLKKHLVDGDSLSPADVETAVQIVMQHHKITHWNGPNQRLVNSVRKADWADATMGLVRFGLPNDLLLQSYDEIPEAGFHLMLAQFGKRLSPDSLLGQLDVLKILKF